MLQEDTFTFSQLQKPSKARHVKVLFQIGFFGKFSIIFCGQIYIFFFCVTLNFFLKWYNIYILSQPQLIVQRYLLGVLGDLWKFREYLYSLGDHEDNTLGFLGALVRGTFWESRWNLWWFMGKFWLWGVPFLGSVGNLLGLWVPFGIQGFMGLGTLGGTFGGSRGTFKGPGVPMEVLVYIC